MARKKKRLTKLERLVQDIKLTEEDLKAVSPKGVLHKLLEDRLASLYEAFTFYEKNPKIGKEEL